MARHGHRHGPRRVMPLGTLIAALVILGCVPAAATAARTVVGFDDLPSGTVLGTQYASHGIRFGVDAAGATAATGTVTADSAARSAPNLVRAVHPREAGQPYTELWGVLSSPQPHVEVYVGDPGDTGTTAQTVTLEAYGSAPAGGGEGTPLATAQVTVNPGEPVDKLLAVDVPSGAIMAFHITDFAAGGHIALDDLAVGANAPPPNAPVPVTGGAVQLSDSGATLTGTVDAKGQAATYHFDYVSAADGTSGYAHSTPEQPVPAGSGAQPVSATLAGLPPGTTYHYRLVASAGGTAVPGADASFTTLGPPSPPPPGPPSPPPPPPPPIVQQPSFSLNEGGVVTGVVARFSGKPDSAAIDWGDATAADTPGTVGDQGDGTSTVTAPGRGHMYVKPGTYTITTTAFYGKQPEIARATVTVSAAPIHLRAGLYGARIEQGVDSGPLFIAEFDGPTSTLRHPVDVDQYDGYYAATVTWGDGTTSDGGVDSPDVPRGVWSVWGHHTYDQPGTYTVTVTLTDQGGASDTADTTVVVTAAPPPPLCPNADLDQISLDAGPIDGGVPTPEGGVEQTIAFTTTDPAFGGRYQMHQTVTAGACWTWVGNDDRSDNRLIWFTRAAITLDGGVVLAPVTGADPPEVSVDASNGRIAAVPWDSHSSTVFRVGYKDSDGSLSILGQIDLSPDATPITLTPTGKNGELLLGQLRPDPYGPHFGAQQITGGDIRLETEESVNSPSNTQVVVTAHLPAPNIFTVDGAHGAAPTGDIVHSSPPLDADALPSSGGSGGGGGGGWTDPRCLMPHSHCNGPPKLASADLARRWWGSVGGQARKTMSADDDGSGGGSLDFSTAGGHYHLTFPTLYLGALQISDAFIDYDPEADLWTGGGYLHIAEYGLRAVPPPPDYGFGIFGNGKFDYGGGALELGTPGVLVGPGVFLQRIGFSFHAEDATHPTTITGDIVLNVAGGVATVEGGVLIVFANRTHPYTYTKDALPGVDQLQADTSRLPVTSTLIGASGVVTLHLGIGDIPLAHAYGVFIYPGYFEFAGGLDLRLLSGTLSLQADVKGAFNTSNGDYDLDGQAHFCIGLPDPIGHVCISAEGHISSLGIGACIDIPLLIHTFDAGFRYPWHGQIKLFLDDCDLGPITVTDVRGGGQARDAAVPGVTVPPGRPNASLTVQGTGGPPLIEVTGPHGERIVGQPDKAVTADGVVIVPVAAASQTLVGMKHPAAGRWAVTTLPGSAPVSSISSAFDVGSAHVTATVTGTGATRVLHWHARPRSGQSIVFAERGNGVFRILGRSDRPRGSLRFRPVFGPGGRRRIVAIVSLGGVPNARIVAGHYTAPPPSRPAPPRGLVVALRHGTVAARWRPVAGAHGYVATIQLRAGRRISRTLSARTRSVNVPAVGPAAAGTVRVAAVGEDGNPGRWATATLQAPPRLAAPRGLKRVRAGRRTGVTWRAVPGAAGYLATVRSAGTPELLSVRHTGIPPLRTLAVHGGTVSVLAIDKDGRPGAASRLEIGAR